MPDQLPSTLVTQIHVWSWACPRETCLHENIELDKPAPGQVLLCLGCGNDVAVAAFEMPSYAALPVAAEPHPPTEECPDPECLTCGERDCPHGDPLHYHHDGCPACSQTEQPGRYTHTNHFGTYELTLTDSHRTTSDGHAGVTYTLRKDGGPAIFEGDEFHPSPLLDPEGPIAASHLLSFFTLTKGDTDADYFDDYTPEQLAFRDTEAETLSLWQEELNPAEFGGG